MVQGASIRSWAAAPENRDRAQGLDVTPPFFALLPSMFFTNSRRWDWAAVLVITAALFVRLVTQVVR